MRQNSEQRREKETVISRFSVRKEKKNSGTWNTRPETDKKLIVNLSAGWMIDALYSNCQSPKTRNRTAR